MGGGQSQGSPSSSITSLVSHTCISAQHQVEADHVTWQCCGKTEMGGESPVAAEALVCVVLTLYDSRGCRASKAVVPVGCGPRPAAPLASGQAAAPPGCKALALRGYGPSGASLHPPRRPPCLSAMKTNSRNWERSGVYSWSFQDKKMWNRQGRGCRSRF